MKTINFSKLLLVFAAISMFAACDNDDDLLTSDDLVGTWTALSFDARIESSFGEDTSVFTIESTDDIDYEVEFDEDSFKTNGSYTYEYTISFDGQNSTNSASLSDIEGAGEYSIDGNTMTLSDPFFEYSVDGFSQTADEGFKTASYEIDADGRLIFTQDETIEVTQSGTTVTSKITSTSIFVKQ